MIIDTITATKGMYKGNSPTEGNEMFISSDEKKVGIKAEEKDGTIVEEETISGTITTTSATTSPAATTWLPLDHPDLLVPSLIQPPSTTKTPNLYHPYPNQYSIPPYSPLPPKKRMLLRTSMEEQQQQQYYHLLQQCPISNSSLNDNDDTNHSDEKDDVKAAAISLLGVCSCMKFPSTTTHINSNDSDIKDDNFTAALVVEDEEEGERSSIYNKNYDDNDSRIAPQMTQNCAINSIYNGPWKKRKHDQQLTQSPFIPPSPVSSHGNSSIVSNSTTTTATIATSQSSYYDTAVSLPNFTSSCVLLNALPVTQWKGQWVEILTGPFQSHSGIVQRWKNGWITVQLQFDRTMGALATMNSPTIRNITREQGQQDEEVTVLHHSRRAVHLKVIKPRDALSSLNLLSNTSNTNPNNLDGGARNSPIATVTTTATTSNQSNTTNVLVVEQTTKVDTTTKAYGTMYQNLPVLSILEHSDHSNTAPIVTIASPEKNAIFSAHDTGNNPLHINVSLASSTKNSTLSPTNDTLEGTSPNEQESTQGTDTKSSIGNNHECNSNKSHYKSWVATAAFDRPRRSIKKPQIYDDKYFEEKKRLLREATKKEKHVTTKNSTTTNSGGSCEGSSTQEDDISSSRSLEQAPR